MAAGCSCNGQRNSICNPQSGSGGGCYPQTGSSGVCRPQSGSGGGCYPQSTGTISPRPQSSWTAIAVGQKFRKQFLDELKTAINSEFGIRSISKPSWTNKNVGDKFGGLVEIRDKINQLRNSDISKGIASGALSFNSTYTIGLKLTLSGILSLRTNTNVLQSTCICNCAYNCTCNCAYNCTCNCAYNCTCNCAYNCTCNCDYCNCNCAYYSCTCACAY